MERESCFALRGNHEIEFARFRRPTPQNPAISKQPSAKNAIRNQPVSPLFTGDYRVIEAHDGPSALRLLERQSKVDLLFTDVVLPSGLTGAQVASEVKKLRPEIKILFTTGYARNAIVHQGRLDAGLHLITKPFSYAHLAAKVRDVLDSGK